MNISDLNYLEVADKETEICGAYGYGGLRINVNKHVGIKINKYAKVGQYFGTFSLVKGNVADAEAGATAYGWDSNAQTLTITHTDPYSSGAYSESFSQSN